MLGPVKSWSWKLFIFSERPLWTMGKGMQKGPKENPPEV